MQILADVDSNDSARIATGFAEFDRVLGGGLVPGSVVLIGGDPGAGKSTLLLQVTTALATMGEVLYVSGEESLQQLAMRARRLELPLDRLRVASETRAEEVAALIEKHRPLVVVLDSIQVMELGSVESVPGSITQVRETRGVFYPAREADADRRHPRRPRDEGRQPRRPQSARAHDRLFRDARQSRGVAASARCAD